eukprot:CAMPEP_0195583954 /NCGR_PEP_ID=MMETSP0814-20130614/25043_1 /TAXON_ID=97485 /ORGANISM="Prymnesium parvum, Strain Texoma1" /LENGTH=145 /DNA_ID=CAMNT_0040721899 /DNA_START=36 /DNA_END=472 /DNA_ORIENTATION=+
MTYSAEGDRVRRVAVGAVQTLPLVADVGIAVLELAFRRERSRGAFGRLERLLADEAVPRGAHGRPDGDDEARAVEAVPLRDGADEQRAGEGAAVAEQLEETHEVERACAGAESWPTVCTSPDDSPLPTPRSELAKSIPRSVRLQP